MTREFKTYGGEDLDPVVDLTEYLEWENTEFSTRSYLGESSPSTFPVRDELGAISASGATYNIGTKNRMEVILDGQVLWKGRRSKMTSNRRIRRADRDRIHDISADDINKDLHGIVVDGWERPAETDVARVQALGAAYLAGSPRATTDLDVSTYVPNTNTVTLPAHTYNRTSPIGVLQEIAGQANKNFFVTIDDELFWDTYDSTAYATTLSISDRPADSGADGPGSDPLCYFPQWSAGPPIEFDGTTWMSGARMFWGPGDTDYVEANDTSQANLNAHWMEILNDDQSTDAASAERRLNAILARRYQGLTYHVAIGPMTDEHIKLLKPGHLINIKARVIGAANSFINRRIVDLTISTTAPGQWFAFMTLDTPHRPVGRGAPAGPRPPASGGSAVVSDKASQTNDDGTSSILVQVGSESNRAIFVMVLVDAVPTVTWYPDRINDGTPGTGQSLTNVSSVTVTGSHKIYLFRLVAPSTSTTATSAVHITNPAGTRTIAGVWVVNGVNQSAPETQVATNSGTGTASSVSVTAGPVILDVAGWAETNATVTAPVNTGSNTTDFSLTIDRSFGLPDYALGGGNGTDATPSWGFTNSHAWAAMAVSVATTTTGHSTEPVGGSGTGTPGTNPNIYAPIDHVHEHGNITTGGPYHMAEDVTFSPTGSISSTNVQAAIAEVASEAGVTDHGALTGLADDDHTQYVRKTDGGKEVVSTVASSGTTETLNLTSGNVHDVTLTDNCTFTFAGATNGVACSMTLLLRQDGSGGRTATWPGSVEWPDSTAPTLATAANAVDILTFLTLDGGTTWFGQYAGAGGVTPESVRDAGRWEVVVSGTPATEVTTEDTTDWVYAWVTD